MSNDEYYVNRCLDGHPDDFRHLVRRYQNVLMAHLVGQLGNMGEAEEVAQETLVRCYFGLSKLKKRGSFFPWLLGISNRVAKEQHRNRQRRRQALSSLAEEKPQQPVKYDYPLSRTIGQLPDFYRGRPFSCPESSDSTSARLPAFSIRRPRLAPYQTPTAAPTESPFCRPGY